MVKTYTRFVFFGKNILWVLVAGTIALVIWIGSNNTGEGGARMVFSKLQKSEALKNIMVKPHYQGLDKNNKPYTVEAESGTQKDKDTVVLDKIRADLMSESGAWIGLNAGTGEINTVTNQLELRDKVELFYEGGYEFRTDIAQVDLNEGSAKGNSPVEGLSPTGTLQANSFSVEDRGKVLHFNGSVRMLLYPAN